MNDDKTTTTDDQATDNPQMSKDDILKTLVGDDAKAPTQAEELAEMKLRLARFEAKDAITKQFPNLPDETVMRLADVAATMDTETLQQFTQDLAKLAEVKQEDKKTNENLTVDAAGSTSNDGDAGGNDAPAMGPQAWGSAVDLAFV